MTWHNPSYFDLPSSIPRYQVIDWVQENLKGCNERESLRYRWYYCRRKRRGAFKTRTRKIIVGIEIADEEDAIAFKLRWGK